jgi:hypothetical protein
VPISQLSELLHSEGQISRESVPTVCSLLLTKAGASREHKMPPFQRKYFMTDVLEDTTQAQNMIRSCLLVIVPEETVEFAFFCEYLKRKKIGKWWVHPIKAVRHRDGHFYALFTPLREDPRSI